MPYYRCPSKLRSKDAVAFQKLIADSSNQDELYSLDFQDLEEVTPFGMLVVGSAIRQKMAITKPPSKWEMAGHTTDQRDAKSLAKFMGFFRSFGGPDGEKPSGGDSYLPITKLNVKTLLAGEKFSKITVVKKIILESERLANVLCQGHNANIQKTIAYSLREIMRNCIEHGKTHEFWFAAQYRPKRNRVEIAVIDEGDGITKSLKNNPVLDVPDDMSSLRLALQPGITGSPSVQRPIDEIPDEASLYGFDPSFYDNSGYGLYITSELCKINGNILLLSGSRSLRLDKDGESIREANHTGTGVRIVFHPEDIGDRFEQLLNEINQRVVSGSAQLSASMLSDIRFKSTLR